MSWPKGKSPTKEHRTKIRLRNIGCKPWNKGLTKEISNGVLKISNARRGKSLTKEHKESIRVSTIGRKSWCRGLTKETDSRLVESGKKISISNMGHISWMKGKHHTQEAKDKIGLKQIGKYVTNETRMRQSITAKINWSNPEFAKMMLHRRIPSGPEQEFICISDRFYLMFDFVGDGTLIIDGKNPDFVCINDEHKLIEIWGDYFHKGEDPQERINFFKNRGYQCIIIWASELKYIYRVISKVCKFIDA